ncbi:MAG: hypothetical protein ACYDD6_06365 [Acidimicrobiales bacterium]
MRAVQLLGECFEVTLADKRVGVAVRGAHAALDDPGDVLGHVPPDVAHLALFAPGDHRVVEHLWVPRTPSVQLMPPAGIHG